MLTAIENKEVDRNVKGNIHQIENQPKSFWLLGMTFMHEIHELDLLKVRNFTQPKNVTKIENKVTM